MTGGVKVLCDRETTRVCLNAPKVFAETFMQSSTGLSDVELGASTARDAVYNVLWFAGEVFTDGSWYLCLGPVRGVNQDISQAEIATMRNYR